MAIILLTLVITLGFMFDVFNQLLLSNLHSQPLSPTESLTESYTQPPAEPEPTTAPLTEGPATAEVQSQQETTTAAVTTTKPKPPAETTTKKQASAPKPTKPAPKVTLNQEQIPWAQSQILMLCNRERNKEGVAPLVYGTAGIQKSADTRAKESSVLWKHARPNGKKWETVLRENWVVYSKVGENLAKGNFEDPENIVKAWMDSPDHRKNILDPEFYYMSVGFYRGDDGTAYWSQIFLSYL